MWLSTHPWMLVSKNRPELFSRWMICPAFSNAVDGWPITSTRDTWYTTMAAAKMATSISQG